MVAVPSAGPGGVVAGADERVVAGQLGRPPRPMSAVVARCPHGFAAAVEVLPLDERGRPFPTLYYLTCPTAVAAIGALESAAGVERYQHAVEADDGLRDSLAEAVRETRARRAELTRALGLSLETSPETSGGSPRAGTATRVAAGLATGVGGVADASRLKCLHAHAAHALARPAYRLGADVLAAAGELWCDDRRCAKYECEGSARRPPDGGSQP